MKSLSLIFITVFGFIFCNGYSQSIEKQSIVEFSTGKTVKFSTEGLSKSQGLKLHIKYPSSWESLEGEHPHIVRKFIQPDKYTFAMVQINKLEEALTPEQVGELFTTEGLKSIIPSNSEIINTDTNLTIEGLRAASIDYFSSATRMNRLINSYNRHYIFLYKDYLVMIQFMLTNKINENSQNVYARFKTLQPLFFMMFNSVVVDNRWE